MMRLLIRWLSSAVLFAGLTGCNSESKEHSPPSNNPDNPNVVPQQQQQQPDNLQVVPQQPDNPNEATQQPKPSRKVKA